MNTRSFVVLMCCFLWAGFVLSISFVEAWLKFQAPNVTLAIGLGIGKLVFFALNSVEWFLACTIMIAVAPFPRRSCEFPVGKIAVLVGILLLQTFWLLPIMNNRADACIAGVPPEASFVHTVYVLLEILKVALLFAIGFWFKFPGCKNEAGSSL